MAEARDMATALMLGETYELAGQRLADENLFTLPLSIPAHASDLMIGIVPRIFEARRQGTGGRLPMSARGRLPQRLMRTLLVVVSAETIEAPCCSVGVAAAGLDVSA
jgi:hypothetical protein